MNGPPLTLILTLPPSQVASVATQWSKVRIGPTVPRGISMVGLVSSMTPLWSSLPARQSPISTLSMAKNAPPSPPGGRSSVQSQSRGSYSGKIPRLLELPTTSQASTLKSSAKTTRVGVNRGRIGIEERAESALIRVRPHLDRIHGRRHRETVRGGDGPGNRSAGLEIEELRPDEVLTAGLEKIGVGRKIRDRSLVVGHGPPVDAGGFGWPDGADGATVVRTPIDEQGERMIRDTAVGVDAAVVDFAAGVVPAADPSRIAETGGRPHVSDRAESTGVLADEPAHGVRELTADAEGGRDSLDEC